MLSAALTLGSAFSAYAVPVAKKASGAAPDSKVSQRAVRPVERKGGITLSKPLLAKTGHVSGLIEVKSDIKAKKRVALRSATAARRAAAANLNLHGTVLYSDSWTEETGAQFGVYTVPATSASTFDLVGALDGQYLYGHIDNGDGRYYGVSYTELFGIPIIMLDTYDTETWEQISSSYDVSYDVMSLASALDPTSGDIYGVFYAVVGESLALKWAKADYENGTSIPIADFNLDIISVGADKNGQFYALCGSGNGGDAALYKVDKATGATELVGPVEFSTEYLAGGCVDSASNTFIQSFCNEDASGLVSIDLATGETTQLYLFPDSEQVVGLYVPRPAAEDKAPAAPELSVVCENGTMDVKVTLTAPNTLFDGTECNGMVWGYKVTADGVVLMEGETSPGEVVEQTVTMSAPGKTSFVAVLSNNAGTSPKAKASCFVGKGAPAAPANVKLVWDNGVATLTWSPVTDSSDGGFLNPAEVTYTVTDADGQQLATGLTTTTFTAEVPMPDRYVSLAYAVRADYAGQSSAPVKSNSVGLRALSVPFDMDMTSEENFALHSILDANDDRATWEFSENARYHYSGSNAGDDWLFSPAFNLEAGKSYNVTALVASQSPAYTERVEILMGTEASPEGMTIEVVPATEVSLPAGVVLGKYVTPSVSGTYYIGFHAISDADRYYLNLKSYSVSAPVNATAPESVENLVVKRNDTDLFKADISFKAPSKALNGSALTGSLKVKILRNDELVKELSVAPGEAYSLQDDRVAASGDYTYEFIPVNAAGEEGKVAEVTLFLGATEPDAPEEITGYVEGNTLKLSWSPVTADINGNPISAANVTYNVWTVEGNYLGEVINDAPLTTTSFETTIELPATQDFVHYAVQAVNCDVQGGANGVLVTVGPAYEMPVVYGGGDSLSDYIMGISGNGNAGIGNAESPGVAPYKGEDYFYAKFSGTGQHETFMTGKIAITGESPVLVVYIYKVADDDINQTVVSATCNGVETELATISNADLETNVWNKCKVSLGELQGKDVQVNLTAVCNSYAYVLYDEISVINDLSYDLSAGISAPATVETGKEFNVTVNVVNEGAEDTDAYVVNLYRNGEVVGTKTMQYGVAEGESDAITFKQTLGLHDGESADFVAEVIYEADENPENNKTAAVTVARKISALPKVSGLAGERKSEGVALTWDAIVIGEKSPVAVVESFEDAESGDTEYADWTFIDGDGVKSGGSQDLEIPGYKGGESTCAFLVVNTVGTEGYEPHSGNNCLASLYAIDPAQNDDWAISPLLPGNAQTLTFWAASVGQYLESFEVLYSTIDSTDPTDFVKIGEESDIPASWSKFSYELPEGALRFAIRNVSADKFMLRIDDVEFTKLDGFSGQLLGYNVYRDGVKLNDAPVAETSFLDTEADNAAHTYHVTAVYDKGESELSEPVAIDQSGVDAILAAGLKVAVEGRDIVVAGAADKLVTINSVDGKTVHAASGDARVAVVPAVYIVTVDRKAVKVVVR